MPPSSALPALAASGPAPILRAENYGFVVQVGGLGVAERTSPQSESARFPMAPRRGPAMIEGIGANERRIMVKYLNDRAESLLDSAGPGTCRPPVSRRRPPVRPVRRPHEELTVRVPLCEGPFELRVPRDRVKAKTPQDHIEGFNPDATPC